jgi:methyltransferase (TIGR00027 family)
MLTPIGATSRWIAAARAIESESPNPLFHDPFARALATDAGFAALNAAAAARGRSDPGNVYLTLRTRFIDDQIVNAVQDAGLRQAVLLAAGMDARAFRFDWPADLQWFELDRPEIFDQKEPTLANLNAQAKCHRTILRADLEHDWITPLTAAGFDASRPTLFVIEGLLVYLQPSAVETLLATVAQIASRASRFIADVVNPDMLTSQYTRDMIARLREIGCPWQFATPDPKSFFERFNWQITVNTPDEPHIAHGRWPYPRLPASIPGIPRSYFGTGRR